MIESFEKCGQVRVQPAKLSEASPKLLVILGVGNELNGDDGVGIYIARKIKETEDRKVFLGHTAPENFAGKIQKLRPAQLIIFDAADFGGHPGEVCEILDPGDQASTHSPSLKFLIDFVGAPAKIIGIQTKSYDKMSAEVKKAADGLVSDLNLS